MAGNAIPHHGTPETKLYYMPGACSLAPGIVASEAGIALDLVKVDGKTKTTETGEDFLAANPNGYVPTLVLDDGQTLTEAQIVVQYLADREPATGLMPLAGEMAAAASSGWLSYRRSFTRASARSSGRRRPRRPGPPTASISAGGWRSSTRSLPAGPT